jgi:transposase
MTEPAWSFMANEARIGKYGYGRDHRPDKTDLRWRYRTFRAILILIGMIIEPGNLIYQTHFKKRYQQIQPAVNGSLVIFDTGAIRIADTMLIRADNLQYLTGKKLNKSDDKITAEIEAYTIQVIDEESGIRGNNIEKLNSTN